MNEILNQFYLAKYNSLDFNSLVKELNGVRKPNRVIKSIIIASRIVYYVSRFIGGSGFQNNLDLQSSSVMSLVLRRLRNDEPISIDEVENIVKTEINFIGNMIFRQSGKLMEHEIVEWYQDTSIDEVMLQTIRDHIVESCPDHLKLSMFTYVNSNQLLIDNYSDLDRYLFHSVLEQNEFEADMEAKNHFLELETITEKALFLNILSKTSPEIFILFTSLKDYNALVLLLKYKSLKLMTPLKLSLMFEDIAKQVKTLVSDQGFKKDVPRVILEFARSASQDKETSLLQCLSESYNKLYDSYEKTLEDITKSVMYSKDMTKLSSTLSKEMLYSSNLVKNIAKINNAKK